LRRANLRNLHEQIYLKQKNIIRFIKERRTIKVLHLFRNYSAFVVVLSSALLVSATNLSAGKESSGFLFGYLGSSEKKNTNPIAGKIFTQAGKNANLAMVPLAQADSAPNPKAKFEKMEESFIMEDPSMVSGASPIKIDPEEDGGVRMYEVKSGDTISGIANNFGITTNTILWANEIDDINSIKPGDKIFILPVAGLSYTVQKGDSLKSIAEKYKATEDNIIAFNDLPANGEISEGTSIIIPGGQKAIPQPAPSTGIALRQYEPFTTSGGKTVTAANGTGHKFPYGYCTWYVASKRNIPWSGNAGSWLYNAKAMGYATGKTPRKGAIVVTTEDRRYGHVALVEKVSGNTITVSEMNYVGWGKRSTRTLDANSRVIKGYIY